MLKKEPEFAEYTVQVVLATMPQRQEKEFYDSVQQNFYETYRKDAVKFISDNYDEQHWYHRDEKGTYDKNVEVVYNPINYYLLGNYDIAYISLIDNFKFAQRLFEPQVPDGGSSPDMFSPHTFQSFTGISPHNSTELKSFFYHHLKNDSPVRKYFIGICNLKLNNGFLIGNGMHYVNAVTNLIKKTITKTNAKKKKSNMDSVEFLLLQSFSWFEMSLMVFTDDPNDISQIITDLRRLSVKDIIKTERDKMIKDSLYGSIFKEKGTAHIAEANIFADTHTYIGIHAHLINCDQDEDFFKKFKAADISLQSEIEWHVKPGHMHLLSNMLNGPGKLTNDLFSFKDKSMLAGRTDYRVKMKNSHPINNVILLRTIMDKNANIFEHVRKMKTQVFFDSPAPLPTYKDINREIISLHQKLKSLAVEIKQFSVFDDQMKALKLSRQIRVKVLKIFSNYNNGIQDIVLFPFVLDFKIFIERLEKSISKASNLFKDRFAHPQSCDLQPQSRKLEDVLMKYIEIFQEGYNIRMLNCYQFEDINDFDLDFNSSIPQLLSMYSTLAFEIGNLVYEKDYDYGPIVQLNLKDTVSNDSSINYYVHHLTSPEFVFATITKEIINPLVFEDDKYDALLKNIAASTKESLLKDENLLDLFSRKLVDINYFVNDAIRFIVTYNFNFQLYYYWFWTYNFQNPSLYDHMGLISESHLEKELFRIIFLQQILSLPEKNILCPIPEILTFWERHYAKIHGDVERYISILKKSGQLKSIMNYVMKRVEIMLTKADRECDIKDALMDDAWALHEKIRNAGNSNTQGADFITILGKRLYAYKYLPRKVNKTGVPETSIFYLQWYMYNHLETIYKENKGKINLLRRNWETGSPLLSFLLSDDTDHMYAIDQTGGLFFDRMKNLNKYFQLSSKVLSEIWHYSLIRKKIFINKRLSVD